MYFMRTTVEIEDATFRRTKALAGLRGISLKELINKALERELARESPVLPPVRHRVRLPLVSSASPGSLPLNSDRIQEILDEEDRNASS